jgi:hypothetical protein
VESGMTEGGMTARTLDYLWLLVDASAWALFSALVTDISVKFKQGGQAWFWAACFFGSALVAAYCLGKLL